MILQFGAGNFLRAFVEVFALECGHPVTVVQSTGTERAEAINEARGRYQVVTQGYRNGEVVNEAQVIDSIEDALSLSGSGAERDWAKVMELACQSALSTIVSNTTEAGLALDPKDRKRRDIPRSFPARLVLVLQARYDSGLHDRPWILPCELVEKNGDLLRDLVISQAKDWKCEPGFLEWLRTGPRWTNTLVDRIVPGPLSPENPLAANDPLALSAEPFAFWAIETEDSESLPFANHPAVVTTADISSFALRKVRILNGAHSALVCRAKEFAVETVRDAVEHPVLGPWLEALLLEEIVPTLEGRCDDPETFARQTLERFRNPFLEHRLDAIALHHKKKVAHRLRPTLEEFTERFGHPPERLASLLC